jgi:hypothetical protein
LTGLTDLILNNNSIGGMSACTAFLEYSYWSVLTEFLGNALHRYLI